MANVADSVAKIREATWGIDVKGTIADGIEIINEEVEATTAKENALEVVFNDLVINAGNENAEIVAARGGEVDLPTRLNKNEWAWAYIAKTIRYSSLGTPELLKTTLESGKNVLLDEDVVINDTIIFNKSGILTQNQSKITLNINGHLIFQNDSYCYCDIEVKTGIAYVGDIVKFMRNSLINSDGALNAHVKCRINGRDTECNSIVMESTTDGFYGARADIIASNVKNFLVFRVSNALGWVNSNVITGIVQSFEYGVITELSNGGELALSNCRFNKVSVVFQPTAKTKKVLVDKADNNYEGSTFWDLGTSLTESDLPLSKIGYTYGKIGDFNNAENPSFSKSFLSKIGYNSMLGSFYARYTASSQFLKINIFSGTGFLGSIFISANVTLPSCSASYSSDSLKDIVTIKAVVSGDHDGTVWIYLNSTIDIFWSFQESFQFSKAFEPLYYTDAEISSLAPLTVSKLINGKGETTVGVAKTLVVGSEHLIRFSDANQIIYNLPHLITLTTPVAPGANGSFQLPNFLASFIFQPFISVMGYATDAGGNSFAIPLLLKGTTTSSYGVLYFKNTSTETITQILNATFFVMGQGN